MKIQIQSEIQKLDSSVLIFAGEQKDFVAKPGQIPKALLGFYTEHRDGCLEDSKKPIECGFHFWKTANPKNPSVGLLIFKDSATTLEKLESLRYAAKSALYSQTTDLNFFVLEKKPEQTVRALGSALYIKLHPLEKITQKKDDKPKTKELNFSLPGSKKCIEFFKEGLVYGEATQRVRELGNLPPNYLNPKQYGERIKNFCKHFGLSQTFHSAKDLKKMGAGAFTAVDQGDPESGGGIHEISYSPKTSKNKKTIALVGKGLCFDTGGYNIKTGTYMRTMKGDMQGSAVALATMIAAKQLGLPLKIKAWLAVTENHISPKAYKPDDVVTALNGVTIEVTDTDAEGRMVLADTLTLATRDKPDLCIDFATLTGSAVRSLGTRIGAVFTPDETLHPKILEAGHASGERLWPFPMYDDYDKSLESKVADTIQCVPTGSPDHILAAIFLKKFVEKDVPWIHVDLSASENDAGLGAADGPFTGFGTNWALDYLRAKYRV